MKARFDASGKPRARWLLYIASLVSKSSVLSGG